MTPLEAVSALIAAFDKEKDEYTVKLYVAKMTGINPQLLEATIERIIDTSRFFPTIAEIRDKLLLISGQLPSTTQEAMGIIRRADVEEPISTRDGEYRYTERYWEWPEDVSQATMKAIFATLEKVGEPIHRDKPVFGWDQEFKKQYEQEAESFRVALLGSDMSTLRLPAPKKELGPGKKALTQ